MKCGRFLLPSSADRVARSALWQPPADIDRTARGWLVKFELAGVRPDQIELTARGRTLTIRGMRRDLRLDEGQNSYAMEISYNQFERSIELPCDLQAFGLTTDYRDGMLIVRLEGECP
jgi:HSP20 family protein